MRSSVRQAAVEQGTDQVDDAGDDGDPMQLVERAPHQIAREVRAGQNLKRRGREHKREEDETADPDNEREHHNKAKDGHDGRIIVGVNSNYCSRFFGCSQSFRLKTVLLRILNAIRGKRWGFLNQNHPQKTTYSQTNGATTLQPSSDSGFLWEKYLSVLPSQDTDILGSYRRVDKR